MIGTPAQARAAQLAIDNASPEERSDDLQVVAENWTRDYTYTPSRRALIGDIEEVLQKHYDLWAEEMAAEEEE